MKLLNAFLIVFIILLSNNDLCAQVIPVELIQTEDSEWQLLRNGEPYFIKGSGGNGSMELLAAAGANTIRTWGVGEETAEFLDQAYELGLTVVVGHWLGHTRHGFDYSNQEMLDEQFERVKRDVNRFKDHPAVLLWGIGNEMEGFEAGDDPNVWNHVQKVAAMVKEIDPNHPTMVVTAEVGGERVKAVHEVLKDIDIHGVNSYGGLPSVINRYREQGGSKPVIITEFGPPGTWEVGKTSFGAPFELTSTQKAKVYTEAFTNGCLNISEQCLGGFAFTWGSKVEATSSWFGMFLPSGEKLAAVDAMTTLWGGETPQNLSPVIESFKMEGSYEVNAGDTVRINTKISDPDDSDLTVEWIVRGELGEYFTGGDTQSLPLAIDGVITDSSNDHVSVVIPKSGLYRIYLTVFDGNGAAATANLPLKVNGDIGSVRAKMPVAVYADNAPELWMPSGWMGNVDKIENNMAFKDDTHSGETSIQVKYKGFDGFGSIAWQHPLNDWGDQPGGFDLTGATKLTFWAKGEKGGEKIDVGVGLLESDRKYYDSSITSKKGIKLGKKWKQYTIDLKGKDLSQIKTGFVWAVYSDGLPVTFYLDDIQFE